MIFTRLNGFLFLNENDMLEMGKVKICYLVSMKNSLLLKAICC